MMEGKREMIKPVLLKLGVALALSFAGGYLYKNQVRILSIRFLGRLSTDDKVVGSRRSGLKADFCGTRSSITEAGNERKKNKAVGCANAVSSGSRSPRDKESFHLPDMEPSKSKRADEETTEKEQEIISLRNMVQILQERERNLEMQMLEYHGLKEQETIIQELHNHLKINAMEAKFTTLKIESLKAENQTLKAQASEYKRVVAELEITKARIKLLKRKMKTDADQANQRLFDLQQKVMILEDHEHEAYLNESETQEKLKNLKDLEDKLTELRTENSTLQNENSELENKLESTQILASVLQCPEDRVLEEAKKLRQVNRDLGQEVERLRMDRCSQVEELVYLKWVNACLRHELRNYKTPFGKTAATNLNKSQSPRSEEKVKRLILEYANSETDQTSSIDLADFESDGCSSSQASSLTETSEIDVASMGSSPNKRTSHSNKQKILKKLKRIFSAKQDHDHRRLLSSLGRTSKRGPVSRRASFSVASLDDDTRGSCSSDGVSSCVSVEHTASYLNSPLDSRNSATPRKETRVKNRAAKDQSMPRLSLDIQSLANMSTEELKELIGDERRTSDAGSTYSYRTSASKDGFVTDSSHQDIEKLELTKFAEILKSTHGKTRRRL